MRGGGGLLEELKDVNICGVYKRLIKNNLKISNLA